MPHQPPPVATLHRKGERWWTPTSAELRAVLTAHGCGPADILRAVTSAARAGGLYPAETVPDWQPETRARARSKAKRHAAAPKQAPPRPDPPVDTRPRRRTTPRPRRVAVPVAAWPVDPLAALPCELDHPALALWLSPPPAIWRLWGCGVVLDAVASVWRVPESLRAALADGAPQVDPTRWGGGGSMARLIRAGLALRAASDAVVRDAACRVALYAALVEAWLAPWDTADDIPVTVTKGNRKALREPLAAQTAYLVTLAASGRHATETTQ